MKHDLRSIDPMTPSRPARIALGVCLTFLVVAGGVFSQLLVRQPLFVSGDAT